MSPEGMSHKQQGKSISPIRQVNWTLPLSLQILARWLSQVLSNCPLSVDECGEADAKTDISPTLTSLEVPWTGNTLVKAIRIPLDFPRPFQQHKTRYVFIGSIDKSHKIHFISLSV